MRSYERATTELWDTDDTINLADAPVPANPVVEDDEVELVDQHSEIVEDFGGNVTDDDDGGIEVEGERGGRRAGGEHNGEEDFMDVDVVAEVGWEDDDNMYD